MNRPPSLSRLLLMLSLPPGALRETLSADFEDEFERVVKERSVSQARAWYRRQARRVVFAYAIPKRMRRLLGLRSPGDRRAGAAGSPGGRGNPLDRLRWDLKVAVRSLGRNPGFAAVVILTLAIGIGATVAALAIVDGVLLRPLPFEEPERLVSVWMEYQSPPPPTRFGMGRINGLALQERTSLMQIAPYTYGYGWFTTGDATLRVMTQTVSADLFELLGARAELGRTLVPADDRPDAPAVVVLGHRLWQRAFGGDPEILGRDVRLDGQPHTVVGIMPADFVTYTPFFNVDAELWTPGAMTSTDERGRYSYFAIARLNPGVSLDQAEAEADGLFAALAEEDPNFRDQLGAYGVRLTPLHRDMTSEARPLVLVLSGAVGLVLLITWVNVTNLLLARVSARGQEIELRAAIGAGRARIAGHVLIETLLLTTIGGLAGLAVGRWLIALFVMTAPPPGSGPMGLSAGAIPLLPRVDITGWVLMMTVLTCAVTTLVCGFAPAARAARAAARGTSRAARLHGGRGGGQLLVAAEVSLALVLLIGVGLLARTMARIYDIPLGFDPTDAQVMRVELPSDRYASQNAPGPAGRPNVRWTLSPRHAGLLTDVVEQLESLPIVDVAGAVNMLPIQAGGTNGWGPDVHFEGVDREALREIQGIPVHARPWLALATPHYFEAMGIPLVEGRTFTSADDASAMLVAIVDENLVAKFELDHPVGSFLLIRDGAGEWRRAEIVGVVGGVFQLGYRSERYLDWRNEPVVYLPYTQPAPSYGRAPMDLLQFPNIVARHYGAAEAVGAAMRDIFRQAEPDPLISFVSSMEGFVAEGLVERRFRLYIAGGLAMISLLLAAVGVYGVIAFQVGRRTHEIGVRMALGARGRTVVALIICEGFRVALLGALVGILLALATTRLLESWLYQVSPTDPLVFTTLSIFMIAVALAACWIPARRAARVDPIASLRAE